MYRVDVHATGRTLTESSDRRRPKLQCPAATKTVAAGTVEEHSGPNNNKDPNTDDDACDDSIDVGSLSLAATSRRLQARHESVSSFSTLNPPNPKP